MKVLRRQKSAYALSSLFFLIWLATVFVTLWKIMPEVSSSSNPFSTSLTLLWEQNIDLIPGLQFRLVYLVVLGDVMLISGVVTWLLSRRWFLLPGEETWFQCPFCKRRWRAKGDKALVQCPHCRQLVHPRIVGK